MGSVLVSRSVCGTEPGTLPCGNSWVLPVCHLDWFWNQKDLTLSCSFGPPKGRSFGVSHVRLSVHLPVTRNLHTQSSDLFDFLCEGTGPPDLRFCFSIFGLVIFDFLIFDFRFFVLFSPHWVYPLTDIVFILYCIYTPAHRACESLMVHPTRSQRCCCCCCCC